MSNNALDFLPVLWFLSFCNEQAQAYNLRISVYKPTMTDNIGIDSCLDTWFNHIYAYHSQKDKNYCFNLTFYGDSDRVFACIDKIKFLIKSMNLSEYIHFNNERKLEISIDDCKELIEKLEIRENYIKLKEFIISYIIFKNLMFPKYEHVLHFTLSNKEIILIEKLFQITNVLNFYKDLEKISQKFDFKTYFIEKNTTTESTSLKLIMRFNEFVATEALLKIEGLI